MTPLATYIPLSSVSVHQTTTALPLCNLQLANDIDLLGGSDEELQQLTERLEKAAAGYGTEISSNNGKTLVDSIKPRPLTNIWMNGKTLEEVGQFRYLGSTQTKDGTSGRSTTRHDVLNLWAPICDPLVWGTRGRE